jgi:pyruvate/2-oxoglutarate dehydrogenase complex dihydrolipoamide acyltransferase (E2) component
VPNDTNDIGVNTVVAYFVNPGEDWKNVTIEASKAPKPQTPTPAAMSASATPPQPSPSQSKQPQSSHNLLLPSVRRLLEEYHIPAGEITGSGRRGLILKGDVIAYIRCTQALSARLLCEISF